MAIKKVNPAFSLDEGRIVYCLNGKIFCRFIPANQNSGVTNLPINSTITTAVDGKSFEELQKF